MSSPLLSVDHLRVSFRTGRALLGRGTTFDAVRDVSFDIEAGQTFGLVGESGSGKSTTGRAILRLLEPSGGTITFDGREVTALGRQTPMWYRQAVQIIFQDPLASLNPRSSVEVAIGDALRQRGVPKEDRPEHVRDLLDQVGLDHHVAERYPSEVSGGQRQRIAIARALAMKPRLMVCDEAVSALDVSTQSQIVNLLQDLQEELGISYLFIAHDLSVVRHVSHRIGVMYLGNLVEVGDAEDVYNDPQHPYSRMLLDAIPVPDPQVQRKRRVSRRGRAVVEPPSPIHPPDGCAFNTRCAFVMDECRSGAVPERTSGSQRFECHLAPGTVRARGAPQRSHT